MIQAETEPARTAVDRSSMAWAVWSAVAAFGAYLCMYAYRKPFTAATSQGGTVWSLSEKTVLVTS